MKLLITFITALLTLLIMPGKKEGTASAIYAHYFVNKIVKKSIDSSITIFANTLRNPEAGFSTYLESAFIMLGHIVLGGIIGFTTIYIALQIFMWLTKDLDELKEIKENNIAVGLLLGIIIVSIALLLEPGIVTVLDSLIPFPPVSLIDVG